MVRDPVGALDAMRRVCRGHLLLLETVSWPLGLILAPVARLDARRDGSEWFVFNRSGLRKAVELAGWTVADGNPARPGGPAADRTEGRQVVEVPAGSPRPLLRPEGGPHRIGDAALRKGGMS